jgi:multidrug efflux pump subunit AcrA (membrane-fusion protein)
MRYLSSKALLLFCIAVFLTSCGPDDTVRVITTPATTFGPTGSTFVVQRGKVVKTLEFDGRISPVEDVPLYFKSAGFVKEIYVRQGDQIKEGDLLAELETELLENQIAQAEVALNSAQALLSEAERSLEHEIAVAELNLAMVQAEFSQTERAHTRTITQTQLSLVLAQEQLARTRALQTNYTTGITSARVALEQAQDAVRRAETEYQEALDRPWELQEVRDGYATALQLAQWNLEVAQAEYDQAVANQQVYWHDLEIQRIAVQLAEVELEQLEDGLDPALSIQVQQAQLALDILREGVDPALVNDVDQAQLALEGLQNQLANARIVAPVEGEVLSISIQPARAVEPFRTIMVIGDPEHLQVEADLTSDQMKELTEGQKASIVLTADPTRTWSGAVLRLPYPFGSVGTTEDEAGAGELVAVSLEGDVSNARPGDLVQVTVILEEKEDVLWLPPAAIRTYQGLAFVVLQDAGRLDVEVGVEGRDRVEIRSGLREGQVVVVP